MFILGRISIVALHLLLITHIAHTFVLLTANVEDVKKIARKFVSDELADKIADFIARATETFAQTAKTSEEHLKDNSQVSAENRMYNNIQRHGFENPNDETDDDNFRENSGEKDELQLTETKIIEDENTDTTPKPKKQVKSRSRYIVEPDPKDTTTEKPAKRSEDKYSQMRESIKIIEHNLVSATKKINTKKEKKNTVKPHKLLFNFDSDETDVKEESSFSQEKKKIKMQRAFDDKMVSVRNTAVENDYQIKKAVPVPMLARNEPENYKNENTKINDKVGRSGSLVKENDDNAKWWEKELPRHNQEDAQLKKSWF